MKARYWIAIAVGVAVLSGAGAAYWVYEHHDRDHGNEHGADVSADIRSGAALPLADILERAAQQVPGEVLKIELENEDRRLVYEIKVLAQNGRVRELKLDARNGELLEIEDD